VEKVFLIGYMGVGKTTIGKRLANLLNLPFYDLDVEIEKDQNLDIPTIYEREGEAFFRDREAHVLARLCSLSETFVLSTGGGTPTRRENLEHMQSSGVVVWLDMPLGMILQRLMQSDERPLLKGQSEDERKLFVERHFAERQPYYRRAKIRFDVSDFNAVKLKQLADLIYSK